MPQTTRSINLMKACYMGNVKAVKELATKENVNITDKHGYTPIQIAMMGMKNINHSNNYISVAMILIDNGADPFKSKTPGLKAAVEIFPEQYPTIAYYYDIVHRSNVPVKIITDPETWAYTEAEEKEIALKDKAKLKSFSSSVDMVNYWNAKAKQR